MNTESADESFLRIALQDAVPPLQEPADRVAEVGARVRRYRARTTAAAALAVAAVLTGGGTLAAAQLQHRPEPAVEAGADCPLAGVTEPTASRTDIDGPIAPSGAIRATLCERPISDPRVSLPLGLDYSPRMLTQDVDQMVSLVSSLPESSAATHPCFAVGSLTEMSLVFGYADAPPVVLWVDRACSALLTADRTRFFPYGQVLDAFYRLYRAQLRAATPVATIPTPTCPTTYDARVDTATTIPLDGIGRNRGTGEALLPDPLAALAACRYELVGDAWVLIRQEQQRTELESARVVLNEQYAYREYPECLGTDPRAMRPTLVDSLWVADTTGAVSEVRVWRRPCAIVNTRDSRLPAVAGLLTYLDALLGTPR